MHLTVRMESRDTVTNKAVLVLFHIQYVCLIVCLIVCVIEVSNWVFQICVSVCQRGPPLRSSGQSFWLQIQRSRVRFPALPDFLSSSGSGTGSTQPREVN
jgi:hypothetical protein